MSYRHITNPYSFEIVLLRTTRKENNWKTEETLERAVVTLETEVSKGPILDVYGDDDRHMTKHD